MNGVAQLLSGGVNQVTREKLESVLFDLVLEGAAADA